MNQKEKEKKTVLNLELAHPIKVRLSSDEELIKNENCSVKDAFDFACNIKYFCDGPFAFQETEKG